MSKNSALAAALAFAFAAAPLLGVANDDKLSRDKTPTGEHVPVFDQIDSDGNGMLDKDEFARGTTAENVTFAEVDVDGDGKVSRKEWDEHKKIKKQQR
ncbi:EF-hand domain-containing protein [Tahibacter caeni]|uniref:EF-hand domain-containing protein n=1 Tax=Tahibacter caeni TaxID=1453545 RepID=UPI002147C470|nr:EF-hand domain-containing protein [Tahibacter caeni]